jgi:colanic acid/amylovoran biosynthesis glycosyltransferase
MHATAHDSRTGRYDDRSELVLIANVRAYRNGQGRLVLTRKYLQGVGAYARSWPGPVTVLVRVAGQPFDDLDPVEIEPSAWPFSIELRPETLEDLAHRVNSAALVLAFLAHDELDLAPMCKRLAVPLVYVTEYSLEVERQIIDANTSNPLLRWRRKLWVSDVERRRLRALPLAAGLQCSGTPTFHAYRNHNPSPILFFDNRVRLVDVIDAATLAIKLRRLEEGGPLRLVFGGRLIRMKGVHHLPEVASMLRQAGVAFNLTVFGAGVLQDELQREIDKRGLNDKVRLGGVFDFEREWLPMLRDGADLFVCCHPQGDPSSTYPEVMSCGVPIVGYDNSAFSGVLASGGGGWATPLGDRAALASRIVELNRSRREIAREAIRASEFGGAHAFEATFAARLDHMRKLSRLVSPVKDGVLLREKAS